MKGFPKLAKSEMQRLLRYIRTRVASVEDSEDIMQDTFLAFYARWNIGQPIHNAVAWLVQTANHKIVDSYRRRSRASPLSPAEGPRRDLDASDLWDIADARALAPEEELLQQELREALVKAIQTLPAEQRDVFLMTEVDGLSFRQIQRRTGAPLNTLLSRKRYAVLKLRKELSKFLETE